jgi:hypothetical protein
MLYQMNELLLVFIPVPFFSFWLWSCIILIFHPVCFTAMNFVTWLVMAVHFMTAIEVFAKTYIHLVSEGEVKAVCAVAFVL